MYGERRRGRSQALRLAEAEKIEVALSNPCFELWLLLHFRDHRATVNGFLQAKSHLLHYHPNYSKAAREFDFGRYREGWQAATERARRLAEAG